MESLRQRLQALQSQVSAKPVWTHETPTVPGWYWYRLGVAVGVVRLIPTDLSGLNPQSSWEWAGPLEEPT